MIVLTIRMMGQILAGALKPFPNKSPLVVAFRCLPMDIDIFLHMNNAMYLRYAELSRWRILSQFGFFRSSKIRSWIFLVVDSNVKFIKPILPFQRFVVSTKLSLT